MESATAYRNRVVDAFTEYPLEGNPLAVFPQAHNLDASTMHSVSPKS
jgi:predicted PhzF superfamily epimerase YddE/YHI9